MAAKPNKTVPTAASVETFVKTIADPKRRKDCVALIALMKKATGSKPKMWGSAIVGFGEYHYRYASGREGDMCHLGFSPRKDALSLYLCGGLEWSRGLLERLGKHKTGKGCLYIKSLEDIHLPTLEALLKKAAKARPVGATSD
jgi:hypothetical protein